MTKRDTVTTGTDEEVTTFWATGDYHAISLLVADLGTTIVEAAGVRPAMRVLDVGAGSGNATLPAARAGATVTALDPTPELMAIGRRAAAAEGLDVEWVPGVAQELPFPAGAFDVVLSCIGAMFAPDHAATAGELLRVCRPGGTIAMVNWTASGGAGRMFDLLGRYGAPAAAEPPAAWGEPDHVRRLLGPGCTQLSTEVRDLTVRFDGPPQDLAAHYRADFAPVIRTASALDPARADALQHDLTELLRSIDRGPAGGPPRYVYEYLLVVGTQAA